MPYLGKLLGVDLETEGWQLYSFFVYSRLSKTVTFGTSTLCLSERNVRLIEVN